MMKYSFITLTFLVLTSCTSFINTFDENLFKADRKITIKTNKQNFCKVSKPFRLVGDSELAQKNFTDFLKSQENKKYSFEDKITLWTLIQMKLRPDKATPHAGIQFFIKTKQSTDYFHIFSKQEDNYPLFYALEKILNRGSRYSLYNHIKTIDMNYPYSFHASENLSNYLNSNKKALKSNPKLAKNYIRGDESLKTGEKLHRFRLMKYFTKYKQTKATYLTQRKLFKFKVKSNTMRCNYNIEAYKKNIFSIHNKVIGGHVFGLKSNQHSFMAITNIEHNLFSEQADSNIFTGESLSKPAAFCMTEQSKIPSIALLSNNSRDPAQHLYHILQYGASSASDASKLQEIINFSRHLILENPKRIIFESSRSSNEHIDQLLSLNIPVYNHSSLGNIVGSFSFGSNENIFIDQRNHSFIQCSE